MRSISKINLVGQLRLTEELFKTSHPIEIVVKQLLLQAVQSFQILVLSINGAKLTLESLDSAL